METILSLFLLIFTFYLENNLRNLAKTSYDRDMKKVGFNFKTCGICPRSLADVRKHPLSLLDGIYKKVGGFSNVHKINTVFYD